mgnify:CR=1 FL=1
MKINSNSKELFNRLDRIIRSRGFSDKATTKHNTPVPKGGGDDVPGRFGRLLLGAVLRLLTYTSVSKLLKLVWYPSCDI